ncbi:MAG: YigZ family protein [Peptostreptococcaceae bacterium]|nr:YigZ family protein [Peptostreptococcaceae bacterium]
MKLFSTILKEGKAEQNIEKSRFICYAKPVENKLEADEFIKYIKKKNKDATHNVPAIVIGDKMQIQWASDDGEPQGTAGAPIVQMMVNEGITNAVVVVTRYFGGVKLGTGGLVRAYTSSAKMGLNKSILCDVENSTSVTFEIDYTYLDKIKNLEKEGLFTIKEISYLEKVEIQLNCSEEDTIKTKELVMSLTNGMCKMSDEKNILIKLPRKS